MEKSIKEEVLERIANTRMTEREREVLELRFGLKKDGRSHTLEAIGQRFKVTRERIRQIEAKAIRLLDPNRPHGRIEE